MRVPVPDTRGRWLVPAALMLAAPVVGYCLVTLSFQDSAELLSQDSTGVASRHPPPHAVVWRHFKNRTLHGERVRCYAARYQDESNWKRPPMSARGWYEKSGTLAYQNYRVLDLWRYVEWRPDGSVSLQRETIPRENKGWCGPPFPRIVEVTEPPWLFRMHAQTRPTALWLRAP